MGVPQIQTYEIMGITVEGDVSEDTKQFVKNTSGLTVGQEVRIPGSEAFSEAIRQLYRVGAFSDVSITKEREVGNGIYLSIHVEQKMPVANYTFAGVNDDDYREELHNKVPLVVGRSLRPGDIERTKHIITDYFEKKGYRSASVDVEREVTEDNRVALTFHVDRGPKMEVGNIIFHGNEVFSDDDLADQMATKENRWWRFWEGETFDKDEYRQDLRSVIAFYNENGYYDARVLSDTIYVSSVPKGETADELTIEVTVKEGSQYYVRNITWEGNTVFSDRQLGAALGMHTGDVFNTTKMNTQLYGPTRGNSDIASLYMDRGYLYFNAQPTVLQAPGDSVDLHFEVVEGDVYTFGEINIAGNTKTKAHVIRRELYTVPGRTFSRSAIRRSILQLQQLNYFSRESLAGPEVIPNRESKTVDLTYTLEEIGGDQLSLSGGWGGGAIGLLLQARLTFNNFSVQEIFNPEAWRPLPAGDGQTLSLAVQLGGRTYQNYSISFREPWFLGRPNPFGFSISHYRADYGRYRRYTREIYGLPSSGLGDSHFAVTSANISYGHRLQWPDDFFQTSTQIGYNYYDIGTATAGFGLPAGKSQKISIKQSLTRNSVDNPRFPTTGSTFELSLEVAPPFEGFIQYYKTMLSTSWHTPIVGDLIFSVEANYGYLGSLTGERVDFERFLIGGTPMQSRGFTFGKDMVYMRGYPLQAISPRKGGEAVGGTILNQYTAELGILAIQTPQLQLAPYLFFDAANTWNGFATYNPTDLYRSAGIGAKVFLPILGMVELSYGYNFDAFPASGGRGLPQWRFQFSLGRGF